MQMQPVNSLLASGPRHTSPTYNNPLQTFSEGGNRGLRPNAPGHLNATIETEYISRQTLDIEFTSKDGDKVSFSMESMQYQKTMLQVEASGSPEELSKVVTFVAEQYKSMKEALVKAFIESQGGQFKIADSASKIDQTQPLDIPEYWNAENTSQRIVDFAVQFLDAFEGSGGEFLEMIKGAIDEGFKQAKDLLGDLPGQVSSLVNDTHDLVMKKLDAWAESKGILAVQPEAVSA